MSSVLEKYAHNFIIDEMVYWPPHGKEIKTIEPIVPCKGKCIARISYLDKTTFDVDIERGCFEEIWNEACAVIKAVTNIQKGLDRLSASQISMLEKDRQVYIGYELDRLTKEAKKIEKEQLQYAIELFNAGLYQEFLEQFGHNCKNISRSFLKRIEIAKNKVNA